MVNGHDLFVGASEENKNFGIWFKEDAYGPDWIRGGLTDMQQGWHGYGYQVSNSYQTCPERVEEWTEMSDRGGLAVNKNVILTCQP